MRPVPILLLLVACADRDDDLVTSGDVQVIADGSSQVRATACLDAGFLDCNGESTQLELHHDGAVTPMPYDGFLFPEHNCTAPLGSPTAPFDVTNNVVHARMTLPPAFELAGVPASEELATSSSLQLTWSADDTPMRWDVNYSCTQISGSATGGPIDDRDGALTIDGAELVDIIGEPNVADGSCIATIEVLRIRAGSMDKAFPATLATGIQSRSFDLRLVP